MTNEAEKIKNWLGRAKLTYEKLKLYEEAMDNLRSTCGTIRIGQERDRLQHQEKNLRKETEDFLNTAKLSPRQYSVLTLHYLEYEPYRRAAEYRQAVRPAGTYRGYRTPGRPKTNQCIKKMLRNAASFLLIGLFYTSHIKVHNRIGKNTDKT